MSIFYRFSRMICLNGALKLQENIDEVILHFNKKKKI